MKAVMNPQLFLSGFKNGPVHTWRTKIELAHPHVSDGIRIHSGDARLTRCAAAHIGYCSPRLDTFFSTSQIQKNPDSRAPSTRYRICYGFFFFHSGERIAKYPDSLLSWHGCKPYPEK